MIVEWKLQQLGDICEFQRGLTYSKSDEVDTSTNVVLRANNVDLATHALDLTELRYISDAVAVPLAKRVRKGSLLICTASGSKSHLGKIAYVDDEYGYAFGGFMGQITPSPGIDGRYLFHALTSPAYKTFIEALSDGININNLKFDDLRQFAVPVPPLPEQRRIVAILDEAFDRIGSLDDHVRRSVGALRELSEQILDAKLDVHTNGWPSERLGDLCCLITKGTTPTSVGYEFVAKGVNFVKVESVTNVGEFLLHKFAQIGVECHAALRRSQLQLGDVLISIAGALGRSAVVSEDILPANTNQALAIVRIADFGVLMPQFLRRVFASSSIRAQIAKAKGGAAQQNLSLAQVGDFTVPLPPLAAQAQIVDDLDAFDERMMELRRIYASKADLLAELKKSLLREAFTGVLSEQSY